MIIGLSLAEKYKQNTNEKLLKYYSENGFDKTVLTAKQMYKVNLKNANPQFRINLNGEICETILEIGILEFMKRNRKTCKDWVLKKGLILKDVDNPDADFSTEIDLILATPMVVYIFECKSYSGNKVLKDKCTLVTDNRTFDVFQQNLLHANVFLKQFRPYLRKSVKRFPLQLALFVMANGSIVDDREKKYKDLMPVVEIENLFHFLSRSLVSSAGGTGEIWNMKYVSKALNKIEQHSLKRRKEHLDYVKRLHGEQV